MTVVINGTTGITVATAAAPAFSAYLNSTQSVANATFTKILCNTEEFDTNANYDNATNYRFTPTVAGYYQVNGSINFGSSVTGICLCTIYKNGARAKDGAIIAYSAGSTASTASALIYLNGSTDYVELYAYQTSGSSQNVAGISNATWFQSSMARSA